MMRICLRLILISTVLLRSYAHYEEDDNDRWEWGYTYTDHRPYIPPDKNQEQKQYDRLAEDPCNYNPSTPDFRARGRRISEVKCYEYIWQLKYRIDKVKMDKKCEELKPEEDREFHVTVVGGRSTYPGEFPHMAALGWKATRGTWIFKCGGSLISPNFVLTASHCTRTSARDSSVAEPVPKIVRLGDKNIVDHDFELSPPTDVEIKRIINHPNYSPLKKYYDIALVELVKSVDFTKFIQPACLWTRQDTSPLGQTATVTGWGVIESGALESSPELKAGTVDIIDSKSCDRQLEDACNRQWCGVHSDQICAGKPEGGVDACQGDSGGPLQVKINVPDESQGSMYYVIGVTSFGVKCGLENTPGIYTRVSSFLDWIEWIVWP